jgi:hypothetical protein
MADFNRYVVTAEVTSSGADHSITKECTFSVAAVDEETVPSALALEQIPHVYEYEILDVKEQND